MDLEIELLGERQLTLDGMPVLVSIQVLDDQVWLAECRFQLPDLFAEGAHMQKRSLQSQLRAQLLAEAGGEGALTEEYAVVLLGRVGPTPDEFIDQHAAGLARLLRSLDKPLDEAEAREILRLRARYSKDDLTVIDWEGAVVIAEHEDFQSDIALLKIGNYQLLRYRMLDQVIEGRLETLRRHLGRRRPSLLPLRAAPLTQILEQRISLLLDFDRTDQSLLLIGDWYSSQVYRNVVDAFYLEHWRRLVQRKLESLAAVEEAIRQNLALSWSRLLEFVQLVGWMLLLVGYIVLYFFEIRGGGR